jgi:hypothetical protein
VARDACVVRVGALGWLVRRPTDAATAIGSFTVASRAQPLGRRPRARRVCAARARIASQRRLGDVACARRGSGWPAFFGVGWPALAAAGPTTIAAAANMQMSAATSRLSM